MGLATSSSSYSDVVLALTPFYSNSVSQQRMVGFEATARLGEVLTNDQ